MSAGQDSDTELIYVPLLNEGVPVLRPTRGRLVGGGEYFVLPTQDYDPEDETWEFPPGSVVTCTREVHEQEELLVARKLVKPSR